MLLDYRRRADCPSHEECESIIELDASVEDLTVGDFLELAVRHAGSPAALLLDREVVRKFYCPECDAIETVYRPFESVVPSRVECPECGENRIPDSTARLLPGAAADRILLERIGIPPLHVLQVDALGNRFLFELAGDRRKVFEQWNDKGDKKNVLR